MPRRRKPASSKVPPTAIVADPQGIDIDQGERAGGNTQNANPFSFDGIPEPPEPVGEPGDPTNGVGKLEKWMTSPDRPDNAIVLDDYRRRKQGLTPRVQFSRERAIDFISLVAGTTMTMRQIGLEVGVAAPLFLAWCRRYPEIGEQYALARAEQMQLRADEVLEIADNSSNDWMDVEVASGRMERKVDHEHVKRSEMRINTRKWLMTKFAPKVFGERLQLEASKETRDVIAAQSDQQRLEGAMALIERAKRRVAEAFASGELSEAEFEDIEEGGDDAVTESRNGMGDGE